MAITNFSTMLIILSALRSGIDQPDDTQINPGSIAASHGEPQNIYRYSRTNISMIFIISVILSAWVFITNAPGTPAIAIDYVPEFCFSAAFLFYAIYKSNFYIKIDPASIIINSFSIKIILIENITKVCFTGDKGGRLTNIIMDDGKIYGILFTLKNHYQMVDTLAACVGKGRWTSDDWWVNKHFQEAASRVATHLETDRGKEGR